MSAIPIYSKVRALAAHPQPRPNTLPDLLHTPSGLALLEIQGTINVPNHETYDSLPGSNLDGKEASQETSIGRLVFPDYHSETLDPGSAAWMKRVYLYVGKHQRLTGEVKKLPKAIAVIRKRFTEEQGCTTSPMPTEDKTEELEIIEIVKWKIIFSQRPEPVGTWNGEA